MTPANRPRLGRLLARAGRASRHRVLRLVIVIGLCGAAAQLGLPVTSGAFTATVTNAGNTAATATYFTCRAAAVGESGTRAWFAYGLAEGAGPTAADATGNNRPGTYATTGVTYATAGPCPRDSPASRSITLDGALGYVSGPATTQTNPTVFSVEVWFQTTTAQGKVLGFGTSSTGPSVSYDRHLYVDTQGYLRFGVFPGTLVTVTSTTKVTDGTWHHAVGTLSGAGLSLYLDGVLVASNASVTTAQSYTGYWRIGYDNLGTWTNASVSGFFRGSIAWAAVYTYALTAQQVRSHYTAGR